MRIFEPCNFYQCLTEWDYSKGGLPAVVYFSSRACERMFFFSVIFLRLLRRLSTAFFTRTKTTNPERWLLLQNFALSLTRCSSRLYQFLYVNASLSGAFPTLAIQATLGRNYWNMRLDRSM